jgi:hypothetical protein
MDGRRKPRSKLTKELLEEHYVQLHKHPSIIAKENNTHIMTVYRALKRHKIPSHTGRYITNECRNKGFIKRFKGYGEISGYYIASVRRNAINTNKVFAVDAKYLWGLFLEQNRKCALSGIEISFPTVNTKCNRKELATASIDRIDNKLGYIIGNVRWVHKIVNAMRSKLSDDEFIDWCVLIARHKGGVSLL